MSISTDSAKLYDIEITFHSARGLPVSDVPLLSADPYILASIRVPSYETHEEPGPPPLLFRTRTIHRTRDPDWGEEVWRVGGVPGAGFVLRVSVRDEDAGKKDDRLGEARVSFFGREPTTGDSRHGDRSADIDWGLIRDGLKVENKEAPIKKRRGGVRAFVATYITAAVSKKVSRHGGTIVMSIRAIGLSRNQKDRRVYTLGPNYYSIHFSPLLGRMMGTKSANASNTRKAAVSDFQANKLQLTGPVPRELQHKYVGYRPFIETMFSKSGISGRFLNHALKKQHRYVYSHDQSTVYGRVERQQEASNASTSQSKSNDQSDAGHNHRESPPHNAHHPGSKPNDFNLLAAQFLHMTQHGAGHRLYTYVITLDGQWRFTETGDEFAIELLSKHSMHADAARCIAFSGEFFVRRAGTNGWEDDPEDLREAQADVDGDNRDQDKKHNKHETRPTKAITKARRHPPSDYELVIDNDSGTYRPDKKLLSMLGDYLNNEANLGGPGGIGRVTPMDGFDESLKEIKKRRAEAKQKARSKSGDESGLSKPMVQLRRGSSVSSAQADAAGLGRTSMSSDEVERIAAEGREESGKGGNPPREGEREGDDREFKANGHAQVGNDSMNGTGKEKVQELTRGAVQVLGTK